MNIAFYAGHKKWGGLNNCGGARTTLLSAQTLTQMGHKVTVVAPSDNFTWFKHPPVSHRIPKNTDAIIACSVSDIDGMNECAPNHAKRFYWMRGLELWQMPIEKIRAKLQKGQRNIVNSSWLERVVTGWGIPCDKVWQGVDIDFWYNKAPSMEIHARANIGCLYNTRHKTKRWDMFVDLMNKLGKQYCFFGFGTKSPKEKVYFLKNPAPYRLRDLYTNASIWFCPTELDSFHNVPLEAALCGCLIMCRDIESNGMEDYATPETSMRFKTMDEAVEMIKNPDYSKVAKMQDLIINKIGDRKQNMTKLLEVLNG